MPYATAPDGTRLYFEEVGTGEPLLLLSGQGGDHTTWDGVRDDFAARYRVVVFDYRGTGASDKPSEPPYSTRGFARDVVAILDHLQLPRAHAYGISLGGRICQWLAIDYPDRVGALVLGCTTPGDAHGVRRPPEADGGMVNRSADPEAALAMIVRVLYSPAWAAAHEEHVAPLRERLEKPIPAYAQRLHQIASREHDAWDPLPAISAPTLVMHGSDDFLTLPANAYLLAERIPGAEVHIVAGGRHGYFVEFREEASRVVLDFLTRHPLPA